MAPKYRWTGPQGRSTLKKIVQKEIPQWKAGLYPPQEELIVRVMDGQDVLGCMATGAGKSAVFAVPIIVFREMARNGNLYPDLPFRAFPVGVVVTPTKGLAANMVLELKKLDIPAFAYCHETVTGACISGRNLVKEIQECKTYNIIFIDPEHLRDKAWRQIMLPRLEKSSRDFGSRTKSAADLT
ncbi:p-loop containing nucleoside triphosphate hydrolase protein [Mycena venus]|uniref:p-loop containing nucleoside triphosphate hydrolase protein n=1 Tax=Mycena venus TaxID=2733690 RepID=A0A8H6Z325_9AGAR|nr:p-loop containing nucleoside triphosphate hydrolase protein [Mycena venus]